MAGTYDHPSYLTRQQVYLGLTVAGNASTSVYWGAPASSVRVRKIALKPTVLTTAATTCTVLVGTASVGAIAVTSALGTATYVVSSDLNATVPLGTMFSIKNGTDATGTFTVWAEMYLDPASDWTGTTN